MGLKPHEFETLTPAEFFKLLDGYVWRKEQQARERIEQAWLIATLVRARKIPPLERLLKVHGMRAASKDPAQARKDYEDLKRRLG